MILSLSYCRDQQNLSLSATRKKSTLCNLSCMYHCHTAQQWSRRSQAICRCQARRRRESACCPHKHPSPCMIFALSCHKQFKNNVSFDGLRLKAHGGGESKALRNEHIGLYYFDGKYRHTAMKKNKEMSIEAFHISATSVMSAEIQKRMSIPFWHFLFIQQYLVVPDTCRVQLEYDSGSAQQALASTCMRCK